LASTAGAAPKIWGLELRLVAEINVSSCFLKLAQSSLGICRQKLKDHKVLAE